MSDIKYTGNNKKHTKLSTTIDYTPYYNPVSYQKKDVLTSKIENLYLTTTLFSHLSNFTISDRNHFHYIFIFSPFL
jgi:hypothetical protein